MFYRNGRVTCHTVRAITFPPNGGSARSHPPERKAGSSSQRSNGVFAMPLMMAIYSSFFMLPVQLKSPGTDSLRHNSVHHADTLHRHHRNPNHRLNHPGNAQSNNSASFYNPSRILNFHSDSVRRSGSSLHPDASCIASNQMAHGLEIICFYNCHGHLQSVQISSTEVCPHSLPENAF